MISSCSCYCCLGMKRHGIVWRHLLPNEFRTRRPCAASGSRSCAICSGTAVKFSLTRHQKHQIPPPSSAPASAVLAPTAATSGAGLKERGDEEGEEEEEEGETGTCATAAAASAAGAARGWSQIPARTRWSGLIRTRGKQGVCYHSHRVFRACWQGCYCGGAGGGGGG